MAQPTQDGDAAPAALVPIGGSNETAITHNALIADTQGNDGLSAEPRVTDVGDRLSQDQATDVLRDRAPANELSHADDSFARAQGRGHPSVSPLVGTAGRGRKAQEAREAPRHTAVPRGTFVVRPPGRPPSFDLSFVSQVVPIDLARDDSPKPLYTRDQTPVRRTGQAGAAYDDRRRPLSSWSSSHLVPESPRILRDKVPTVDLSRDDSPERKLLGDRVQTPVKQTG